MSDNGDVTKQSKQKIAIAIKYEAKNDIAPKIIASGKGLIAEAILELAKEKNISSYSDAELAEVLTKLDVGTNIPLEAYAAVAEILALIYKTDKNMKTKEK